MEKQILEILKEEDRLMSLSEILDEFKEKTGDDIDETEVALSLEKLCKKNIISTVETIDGNKYCYVETTAKPVGIKTPVATNTEIKKINKKICTIAILIAVVFVGLILFICGIYIAGGFEGHGSFVLGAIGMFMFFFANIAVGLLAGPLGKITEMYSNWTDYNTPKGDATVKESVFGCARSGCGDLVYGPLCLLFCFIGFVFGIIAIKKLIDIKKDLK